MKYQMKWINNQVSKLINIKEKLIKKEKLIPAFLLFYNLLSHLQ